MPRELENILLNRLPERIVPNQIQETIQEDLVQHIEEQAIETPEIPDRLFYDTEVVGYTSVESQAEFYQWSIQGIDLENSLILDMGAGRGDFNEILKVNIKNYQYIGIDTNKMLVNIANQKYTGIDFRLSDWNTFEGNVDWSFNIFGISYNYLEIDKLEFLKTSIQKALDISNKGCVFILLCDNNGISQYIHYDISDVCKLVNPYLFGIDKSMPMNAFKLVIFKQ